jgi:hypothetical protein
MNLGTKALDILKTYAPMIALAVGGPAGPFAAAALHAVLGTTDDKQVDAAITGATPDQLIQLRTANQSFEAKMKELDISEEQLRFADTASARAREMAVKDHTPTYLAYLTTFGFFASLAGAFFLSIPDASKAIVFSMIGSLGTVWITQQGYYFGSSAGSADKSAAINKIAVQK